MSRSSAVAGPRTGIFALAVATAAGAQQPVPIGDAGFENGALGGLPNGWVATQGTMYVTPGFVTAGDPPAPYAGMRFLSATWQAIGLTASPYPAGQTMALRHDVDLSPWAGLIDAGDRQLELSFAV
ncbi:MAG: hypothetical protein KDE27_07970, partial [Planctomycetes bacterium]|nr:hypothetical protein [Planctomycetota bacterium]